MGDASFGHKFMPLLGRVFFSAIFLFAGVNKLMDFSGNLAYTTSHGLPFPEIALVLAIIIEIGAGLMVLLGFKARFGAFLLLLFTAVTTFYFHAFWALEGAQMQLQMIMFMKNLAMMGGALFIMTYGAGRFSIDHK